MERLLVDPQIAQIMQNQRGTLSEINRICGWKDCWLIRRLRRLRKISSGSLGEISEICGSIFFLCSTRWVGRWVRL